MSISSDRMSELLEFANVCRISFNDLKLLDTALTHTSYAYENKLGRDSSYERLEFLGDAVLKLSVSDILFFEYKNETEGELSARRSVIVSDKTISGFARKLNMDKYILSGKCEEGNKKSKETISACAFEALLGTIYIENGYLRAREFLFENFKDEILNIDCSNPKAELQEFTQAINHNLPEYVILEESGPAHNKTFTAGVYYNDKFVEKGTAKSKKEAEFLAAKKALEALRKMYGEDKNV